MVAKTMVVARENQQALALQYFGLGPLPNAASLSDVPTQFAGGAQLSVPYAVLMMSALRIDWFRFFFGYS